MRPLSKAVVLVALVLLFSCGREGGKFNLIVIAVDTLRPDHLGCYGYKRSTSPGIDRLAADGVLCENAMSQSPWTLPSFATVFTSLYPAQHGAVKLSNGMRTSFPTLAEILKDDGYATGAVVNAPVLKPMNRVNRGFDFYNFVPLRTRVADGTTSDVLGWIDGMGDQPFFMFAHYFDPHRPYSPPAPYHRVFDPDYDGRIGDSFDLEGFNAPKPELFSQMKVLTPADWNHIEALYDGEIAFTDREIGRLLEGLRDRDLVKNTLIVFLSDHGEEFNDHGGFGHGHSLYNELIKVPLIFSLPGVLPRNASLARQVRLLDVMPTVLDILDIQPDADFEGVSLKPLLLGEGAVDEKEGTLLPPDVAYAEATTGNPESKTVMRYPWKLIYNMGTKQMSVYNLAEDPGEQRDLAPEKTDDLAPLDQMLFMTIFGTSDTWYVELAGGGEPHRFNVKLTVERGLSIGNIHTYKLMDSTGRLMDTQAAISQPASHSVLSVDDLELSGTLTLAFQADPSEWPLEFDILVDGRTASETTYLGPGLHSPHEIPFTIKRHRGRAKVRGQPRTMPDPPYVLVWLDESDYGADIKVKHDEETKKELRALGYIQ